LGLALLLGLIVYCIKRRSHSDSVNLLTDTNRYLLPTFSYLYIGWIIGGDDYIGWIIGGYIFYHGYFFLKLLTKSSGDWMENAVGVQKVCFL